ncbi:MAG TPA: glycosyltransferase family 4 protein, partial [Fibrobacteria bacterium]|nr:glycosyltransferase family 4 protein [Fibrobacteria bacterium]
DIPHPITDRALSVSVAGLRGVPDIQGGVERHCQMLYPRLVPLGIEPVLYARSGYVSSEPFDYQGAHVVPLRALRSRSLEAISHTCLAILHAHRKGSRFLHLHAIGPAVWTPFAKRLGFQVVVTHHGFDYRRQKWGRNAKTVLRKGEQMAVRHADGIICISREILQSMQRQGAKGKLALIPNGVERPKSVPDPQKLAKWGLDAHKYFLLTARFVREKGITDLIQAWGRSGIQDQCRLVVAGGEDHPSELGKEIQALAESTGACLTGVVRGEDLCTLYAHARAFVLPSYHEGLPISLLEAMSWDLPVIASSIEANLEVGLAEDSYFPVGNLESLAQKMRQIVDGPLYVDHQGLMERYNWDAIARSTASFYRSVAGDRG